MNLQTTNLKKLGEIFQDAKPWRSSFNRAGLLIEDSGFEPLPGVILVDFWVRHLTELIEDSGFLSPAWSYFGGFLGKTLYWADRGLWVWAPAWSYFGGFLGKTLKILKLEAWNFSSSPPPPLLAARFFRSPPLLLILKYTNFWSPPDFFRAPLSGV